jgi:hypothetical protein
MGVEWELSDVSSFLCEECRTLINFVLFLGLSWFRNKVSSPRLKTKHILYIAFMCLLWNRSWKDSFIGTDNVNSRLVLFSVIGVNRVVSRAAG